MSSVVSVMLLSTLPALALNPSHHVSQYGHATWSLRAGAFKGYPSSFAQTPDGYLWLGTELGLLRFDGVRFSPWHPPEGSSLPSNYVIRLLTTRDGSLWIGTSQGLARWKDGTLKSYEDVAGQYVLALLEERNGSVWAGTQVDPTGHAKLCAIREETIECSGGDGTLGHFVSSLYEDRRGNLWVGGSSGLWRWKPFPSLSFPTDDPFPEVPSILEDADGTLLAALARDVRRMGARGLEPYPLPLDVDLLKPTTMLLDRHGGLWIGTQNQGVLHVHGGRADRFTQADGLSGDMVTSLFEDREGNVWVATLNGVDRFWDTAAATITTKQGLPSDGVVSVLAGEDGSVWLRTINGLERWKDGKFTRYGSLLALSNDVGSAMFQDDGGRLWMSSRRGLAYLSDSRVNPVGGGADGMVLAVVQDRAKDLWLSDQRRGLLRIHEQQIADVFPWGKLGGGIARAMVADPVGGGVWLGLSVGGVAYWQEGQIRSSFTASNGLGQGEVASLLLEPDGVLWAATEGGISRFKDGQWRTLAASNGLPCETVHRALVDDSRSLWLHTACGLVRVSRQEIDAWVASPRRTVSFSIFDDSDGFPSHARLSPYSPSAAKAADGRLWFATYEGAVVVDPRRIPFNQTPPPVHIEQITADREVYDPSSRGRLPGRLRDLRIDYSGLSFVMPELVRFRYKLEGRDADWVDAVDRRQAFYTDLPPAKYRFRVMAANNDGVWNEAGDSWEFEIPPAFYQTTWFRAGVFVVFMGGLFSLYTVRLRNIAAQLNLRFEERLAERTRIAQELHDTLLQGSISASMQLHVLAGQVADQSTKGKLDHILQRFGQMIDEGRQTVQTLRTTPARSDALEHALTRDAKDLSAGLSVDVKVSVHGQSRSLHPLVRDDCYRIGREALANALRHARAKTVTIEVVYFPDRLRLWICDDGRGVDPAILESGRPGHWGVLGMRERAQHIGATINFRSRPGTGTEVELIVPGSIAFDHGPARAPAQTTAAKPAPSQTATTRLSSWFQRSRRRAPASRSAM